MSDRPENVGAGALFKNAARRSRANPTIGATSLTGWVKEGKRGKYLSIVARPDEQEPQECAGDAIPF